MPRMLTVILTLRFLREIPQLHISIHRPESDYNSSRARLEEYFIFVHGAYSHLNFSTLLDLHDSFCDL
jgi:hypothetical protein